MATSLSTPALALSSNPLDLTHIQVMKKDRRIDLIQSHSKILKSCDMRLGGSPDGHKAFEGDGKTPEGVYRIDRRNPNSQFFRSLGVSYPNVNDRRKAQAYGRSPGGDIFIHGQPNGRRQTINFDWTRGCIAVSNSDMEELWAVIRVGTEIRLYA